MVGKHAIFEVNEVGLLQTMIAQLEEVKQLAHDIAKQCELNVVAESGHQFYPYGVTYVLILAESHLTIHTYPEHRNVYIDIFCCNDQFNEDHARRVIQTLFETQKVSMKCFVR
jgi:S-adenosylmethionine decarboxylase proenzyme